MVLGRAYCSQINVLEWRNECDFNLQKNLDIWRIYIPDFIDKIEQNRWLLTAAELSKSEAFLHEEDRNRFLLGKIFLRKIIAKYLKIADQEVGFDYLEFKKPVLPTGYSLNFNISHSGDYIVFGFANRHPVGVDVELMDSKVDLYNLIYTSMSSVEISSILNSEFPRDIFYKHWTRKEALLKGVGIGLTDRLMDINVCDGLNFVPSEISGFTSTWSIRNFIMDDVYSVSLACDSAVRVVRFYELTDR
ncbi:4'-phosphopantetheinyl transferase superfamily protein [Algoriphagus sp. Y33]|uniref:4'-phosphopantetheinyl transferase family protein n=1 Tax=Algoriphagus sp. Y33 TaxID=2772483 RepID=UPI00177F8CBE|nr:4'-phosphopantetheinyl transferase superfamily protein [Algoriphagus sp. Y33]